MALAIHLHHLLCLSTLSALGIRCLVCLSCNSLQLIDHMQQQGELLPPLLRAGSKLWSRWALCECRGLNGVECPATA